MDKRGAMDLSVKALFAVFLVIFAVFAVMMQIQTRSKFIKESGEIDYFGKASNFFLIMLSSPDCFAYGSYEGETVQKPIQGVLSNKKIMKYKNKNADLSCIDNYDFIYSIHVLREGSLPHYDFRIGANFTDTSWAEKSLSIPLTVAIRYDDLSIYTTQIILDAYFGSVPKFYGKIKEVCALKEGREYQISTPVSLSYNATAHEFCIGKDCFTPSFSCPLDSFSIDPGNDQLLFIDFTNSTVKVKA